MSSLLYHLRRAALALHGSDLTDGELLDAFAGGQDGACFEALVRRHGPMVWGVCRRVLRDHHDAEDAFQATFLVLARRAATVPRQAVGNWLYGVAYRTALNARRAAARRRAKERPEEDMPQPVSEPAVDWAELRPLLDQELGRLPDKYRSAVVLCDLEGRTRAEAARHLGVPEGTVSGRLTTARRMLADRLTRRGLALSVGALVAALPQGAAAVPAALVAAAVRAGEASAAGALAGAVSTQVAALADGVIKGLAVAKWKPLLVALFVAPVFGGAVATLPGRLKEPPPAAAAAEPPAPPKVEQVIPAPRPAERTDLEKLQGTWGLVSAESGGKSLTDQPSFVGTEFVFAKDRFTSRNKKGMYEGMFRLDTAQNPKVLEVVQKKNVAITYIYEVTDTQLRICWRKGGPLPKGFDMAKEHPDTILYVLEKR